MKEEARSNEEIYEDWLAYIKKRNAYYRKDSC